MTAAILISSNRIPEGCEVHREKGASNVVANVRSTSLNIAVCSMSQGPISEGMPARPGLK